MLTRVRICIISRNSHAKPEDVSRKCSIDKRSTLVQFRPSGIRDMMILSVRREWALATALIRS